MTKDIWNFVTPTEIIKHWDEDGEFYLCVSCGCEWEEEHVLQLVVFKDGQTLTRASGHDEHFATKKPFAYIALALCRLTNIGSTFVHYLAFVLYSADEILLPPQPEWFNVAWHLPVHLMRKRHLRLPYWR